MTSLIRSKLADRGHVLEVATPKGGPYVSTRKVGSLVYLSGQLPFVDGEVMWAGQVGDDLTIEDAQKAAIQTFLNSLSAFELYVGSLDKIKSVVQIRGYVRSTPDFAEQHVVLNPLSELLDELFPDGHVRTALGVGSIPCGAAVELEIVFEVNDE